MKRITISLPDEMALVLEREARRRSVSVSEITREALGTALGLSEAQPRRLGFVALGRSGHSDTSERVEEILAEEWAGARDR